MFIDEIDNLNDLTSYYELKTAGKVNFNTVTASDYLTNEAYKTLRTNILFCGADIKTIVITSAHENEGKSTIATELSKSLAEINKRTLLIDADMRKSVMLRRSIKTHNILGLSELLSSQAELNQVIYNTQHHDFDVIFSGHFPPNPVELLGSTKFKHLLEEFKKAYDYIIIDSPPLGAVIDAAVIADFCDGAVLVISCGKVGYPEAIQVKEQLLKSGCKLLGAVLNDAESNSSKYYKRYYSKTEYKYYTSPTKTKKQNTAAK